ncbi:hypothetical protein R5R35_005832 [Gryllus longicercus]|uniref:Transcription factor TFIIIC triple barrel domain-containing protein n=1 Tax=Gryllus longicercus TaxID=2509291 RepID=A0AAN9W0Y8_9ORTH
MGTEEEEEEEYLVHVEFDSILDSETFKKQNLFFKVIGIDSEKPVMQIGDQVFTGQYRDIPGTSLFFEEDDAKVADDAVFAKTADTTLRYEYKTRKSLVMRRVFIKKKGLSSANSSAAHDLTMKDAEEMDVSDNMAFSGHAMGSESLLGSELGMEISGVKLETPMNFSQRDVQSVPQKPAVEKSNASAKSVTENPTKNTKCSIEPVAGPSWAPDISPVDCDEMFEELPTSTVNADEMSRLIVEQMTLESDIKMQNSTSSTQNID